MDYNDFTSGISKDSLEEVLDNLLAYKNSETENKVLKEYVFSFNSRSEVADEVLSICSKYSKLNLDFTYYFASAYNYKGKSFREDFIKYALKYMENPTNDKEKTIGLLRELSKTYASEYEFYKAIDICDVLLSPDYGYINANLLKAEHLIKIRRMDEALQILESAHEEIKVKYILNEFTDEEDKFNNDRLVRLFENSIMDCRDKQNKGYIYVPANAIGKEKLKALLEFEGRYIETQIIDQAKDDFNSFVCFDFETTGFSPNDKITEIGAVKVVNGNIVEYFSELVNPKKRIPDQVVELTGITNEMVQDKEAIYQILPRFFEFIGDNILVAHNARFDCRFLLREAERIGREIKNPVFDTMTFARRKLPGRYSYRLETLAEHFEIEMKEAHRAYCDAEATAKLYFKLRNI